MFPSHAPCKMPWSICVVAYSHAKIFEPDKNMPCFAFERHVLATIWAKTCSSLAVLLYINFYVNILRLTSQNSLILDAIKKIKVILTSEKNPKSNAHFLV